LVAAIENQSAHRWLRDNIRLVSKGLLSK